MHIHWSSSATALWDSSREGYYMNIGVRRPVWPSRRNGGGAASSEDGAGGRVNVT